MAHPTQLGKYTIDGVLGSGAMGVVYQATDPVIQRRVALKTIQRSLVDGDVSGSSIAARFRNEAQAAGRLQHPGIVSIYEYGEDGDTAFIAMEFVEGQDLSKLLTVNPIMSEPMLLQVMDQLLAALHYAHEKGVWHRDIKPANLILTQSGQLKVTDFGIARIRDAGITQVTSTIGTHGYMAPEQYRGQDIDHRVDIFAAGVLLYRLLAGESPFSGAPETIMYRVMHITPPLPSASTRVKRSIQLDSVVMKALAKDVKERYATAGAFREALRLHAAKTNPGNPVIDSVLHGDETVVDPLAAQLLRAGMPVQPASNWDTGMLTTLERALASFVGPLAKMLVKQAAASSTDYNTLIGAVANHLQTDDERAQFMAKIIKTGTMGSVISTRGTAGSGASSMGSALSGASLGASTGESMGSTGGSALGGTGGSMGSGSSAIRALTPEFIDHATRVLASHMGPLAKIVVKKAQAQTALANEFMDFLVQQCADGVDKAQLLKELQKGLK
ncbi:MAG: serine/threonine protein kinase [Aquabacterium sp.]|uniref:serine/threonine-protein kinase n=1 Tax=Aquabacterium sp. TaxID=1872578 RepID=UPI001217AD49|nr:serine/threonine-protein kinase [Aquabacterium sp.]TAK99220.1 MAG: serine/threonine protein kinase [Aquabacterium sp.]